MIEAVINHKHPSFTSVRFPPKSQGTRELDGRGKLLHSLVDLSMLVSHANMKDMRSKKIFVYLVVHTCVYVR